MTNAQGQGPGELPMGQGDTVGARVPNSCKDQTLDHASNVAQVNDCKPKVAGM
jgi:hypothetical protein